MNSTLKKLINLVLWTSTSLLISSIFWPLIIISASLLFLIRYLTQKILNFLYGFEKYKLACGIDSLFAYDKVPQGSVITHTILIIKGRPNLEKIREKYEKEVFKFVEKKSSKNTFLYAERFKKTFTSKLGFACWKDTSMNFDIRRHVRFIEGLEPMSLMKGIHDKHCAINEDKLLRMTSSLMDENVLFRNEHPQWEHLIIPNYLVENSSCEHFACIIRVHHAYADGCSFGIALDSVLSDTKITFAINPMVSNVNRFMSTIAHIKAGIFGPLAFIKTLQSAINDKSKFILNMYSGKKHLAWSNPIDMRFLKEVRTVSGASMSSILMTGITGAIGNLHNDKYSKFGEMPKEINFGNMSVMLPYKTRQVQNHFTTFSIPCPLQGYEKRLKKTDKVTRTISSSCEPIFNFFIMRFSGYLPRVVQNALADLAGTPIVFSNIPGPKDSFGLFGGVLQDAGAFLPLVKTYGLGISTFSYCDQMRICISTDSSLFETQSELKSFIQDMESELKKLGNSLGIQIPQNMQTNYLNNKLLNYTNLEYCKAVNFNQRKLCPTA